MRFEDPLEEWLDREQAGLIRPGDRKRIRGARQSLERLGRALDSTPPGRRVDYTGLGVFWTAFRFVPVLPEPELAWTAEIHIRVCERPGSGSGEVQKSLLDLLGRAARPAAIPFWKDILNMRRSRDSFSNTRRKYALAALAFLMARAEGPARTEALDAMVDAFQNDHPETRAMAAYYLGHACTLAGPQSDNDASGQEIAGRADAHESPALTDQATPLKEQATPLKEQATPLNDRATPLNDRATPLNDRVASALAKLAVSDRSFAPRFMARRALDRLGLPVPLDNPEGSYAFKVWHTWNETVHRVIELASTATLNGLHKAIQRAWNWGQDHLYVFYLNGRLYDSRYEFAHDCVDPAEAYACQVSLGQLGLRRGHKFVYLFDFGDMHKFQVKVERVSAAADQEALPRVVESVGQTMEQYPMVEE